MKNQIMMFIEEHNLFSDKQFGFRQNHSTEQMLLSVLQEWKTKLDQTAPCYIGAVSLDVRKAFDTVNHKLLLHTLGSSEFSPSTVALLTHWIPLHNINCAHLGTGPLFKFNGIVYQSRQYYWYCYSGPLYFWPVLLVAVSNGLIPNSLFEQGVITK